jgi:hypothetical protein
MDTTNLTNISSLQGVAYYTNEATGGILFSGGLIVFFFIVLMVSLRSNEDFANALAVASWSMFLVSVFFWFAHLTPTMLSLAFLFIAGFSVLYLYASKR